MEKFHVLIPARYASTRLKAKMLADIHGKPMLQHVYERAIKSAAASVVIATDDERISEVAKNFGAEVCMTSPDHLSGTSRLSEAAKILGFKKDTIVVNVQGDEPLISPVIINQVAKNLIKYQEAKTSTLCVKINSAEDIFSPGIVKVVMDQHGYALYFSRAPIPWDRKHFDTQKIDFSPDNHYRHLGIYCYRVGFLEEYAGWQPCVLEGMESLEQLRILWHGEKIHVGLAKESAPPGVDTEEDLIRVRKHFISVFPVA